nr:MAG TPA: hypothetical protein [Caudoviricetes sp.]
MQNIFWYKLLLKCFVTLKNENKEALYCLHF